MENCLVFKDWMKKGIKILNILTFIFLITMQQAGAQDFPIKPVTLLVPYAAGGPVDLNGRSLAEIAKEYLGQPIVLINRPGGGGIVAASIVAKEKPDGYNLAIIPQITFVTIPQMREVSYDPLIDFEFIVKHMIHVGGIFCRADKPWKSMKDLVAYSKQHPGKVTYGTPGTGGASHIGTEFILAKEGVKWRMIPYDGSIKVVPALLGGHIDLAICDMIPLKGHVKSGEVRVLAIEGPAKAEFPDAATFEELGYELGVGGAFGIVAPKGTPADIVKKLQDSFKKAIEDPRYEASCKNLGAFKTYASGEEFFGMIKREYELRGKVLKELGLAKSK